MQENLLTELAAGAPLQHWITLGPFIIRTSGQFEREYMYERERILDVDYLAAEGGETNVEPSTGRSHINIGIGAKTLAWQPYAYANLGGNGIAEYLIYETVQRNCVIYAATVIQAEHACLALLDATHSGMKAWVNGELVCNEPYGRAKGVRTTMSSKPISLKAGRNRILIKFRPGYIADGVDFCVRDIRVSPLVSQHGVPISIGRVRPQPHFTGSIDAPRQVIEVTLVNSLKTALQARVSIKSDDLKSDDSCDAVCEPGAVTHVRLSLLTTPSAAGKAVRASVEARVYGKTIGTSIEYEAAPPPKYDGTTFMLSAFHFDTTYVQEQRVYAMGAFDIMRQYCALHRKDPYFKSTISEIDYLKPYFDVYPEDRETLLKAFRENRSDPDVMYNQPNEQTCGGEALVRNFLYGQLFHGRVLGNICHAYGPGDVFGHPNQLSQIARKSGCLGVTWDKHIYNFPPFFDHLSLDGSVVPHKRGGATWDETHAMGLTINTGEADQNPPTAWHGTLVPKVQQATYYDLMSSIHRDVEERGAHLPVTSRDMSLYHAATAMSRIELKIGNRLGENVLLAAEKFATIASLLGAEYPEKALDKAWRQILCGQHHDSITGTHNEISFVDLMNSYREILELGTDALNRSLDYLGRAIDPAGEGQPLVVFNSLAWERTDVIRTTVKPKSMSSFVIQDHRGKNVPFEVTELQRSAKGAVVSAEIVFVAAKLPSLGYRAYRLVASSKPLPQPKTSAGTVIENEHYRITVDPARGGGIKSLYDKAARKEVINSASHVGNEIAVLEEVADREETQHEFYTTGLGMFSGERAAAVEILQGPVSSTLRIRYSMVELCDVVQEITLYKGIKRVEFKTIFLDCQRENYLYCVTFPTTLKGAVPVFDERFGVVTRNDSQGYLDFRTHQMAMFSNCAVYAANKWMEYGSSAILQAGRNKYALGMVGLITPKDANDIRVAEELQRVFVKKGVTCTPWYDKGGPYWGSYHHHMDEDLLYTRFRISMGSRRKNTYSKKLLAAQPAAIRKGFEARLKADGFACLLVKDGDLQDKWWSALPVLIIEASTAKALDEGVARLLSSFPVSASITLPAACDATGESRTVDNYGVAVLNEGTYANSIEKGGVICMMLHHTCQWYGGTNNFPEGYLVPENRNHVFRYALYPHAEDWRGANTQHASHEFNHPLLARETRPAAKPCLPAEQAFLKVGPKNLILAAMKPFGNPIAGFEKNMASDARKGIMLRLYDTEGIDSEARIEFASAIQSAWSANLLEEYLSEIPVTRNGLSLYVSPFSIETIGFEPGKLGRSMGAIQLGATAEPVQPVWVRSWEHDAESMPIGYLSVCCSIGRQVLEQDDGRTLKIKVNAVNDYTDAPVSGVIELLVPDGWTAHPSPIGFELPPLGHQITEVTVTRPEPKMSGQLKLRYEDDGQTFQDVLEIGDSFDLQMAAENRQDVIVVTVHNPTSETIEGEVSLVTPLETWSKETVGAYALLNIVPRTQGVSVAGHSSVVLEFKVTGAVPRSLAPRDSYWAVAKLMSNGRITLKRCDNRPPSRRMYARKWNQLLRERADQHHARKERK
ncbi:MAG: hypothetical protein HZB26_18615 [Candidatus Hydrogenedentes bacterium]|nr:hypothetical protein [Candidatus Hydrogenedentota bacterium]